MGHIISFPPTSSPAIKSTPGGLQVPREGFAFCGVAIITPADEPLLVECSDLIDGNSAHRWAIPIDTCLVDWLDSDVAQNAKGSNKGWPKGLTTLYDAITTATIEFGFDHRSAGLEGIMGG